jgi:hypothetical protein
MRTVWRNLMVQQRRLTRERIIVTIDELVGQQVDQLKFWTHKEKWGEVARGLARFQGEVAGYPSGEWREHVADVWLHHAGVKNLMKIWADRMMNESPSTWQAVRKFTDKMEEYAQV